MTFLHNKPLMWVVGNLIHDLCACVERKLMAGPSRYDESKQSVRYFSLYTYNVSTALNRP